MTHPTRAGIGLVRLGDSDFVPQNPEDDVRGKDVYDAVGQRIGSVEDLYIDPQEREMRFLQVSAGGFLGMGEKPLLVPVEAVVEVAEDHLTIEPGRTRKVEGPAPFGTRVAPSGAGAPGRRTAPRSPITLPREGPTGAAKRPAPRSRTAAGHTSRGW
jgi:sporulation protein YlmC with PRC-barrel domain